MKQPEARPTKHVFVCTNMREDRSCCAKVGGEEVVKELKEWIIQNNIRDKVWVTKSKCLGFCNDRGANVVIYPQGNWFLEVTKENIDEVKKQIKEQLI